MTKSRILKIVFSILLLSVIGAIIAKPYLTKVILYTTPDINDFEIFENRTVNAGTPQPWTKSKEIKKIKLAPKYISTLENLKTVAFLVVQNNELKYEKYWDNYSDSSLSNSFSVAKSIIGLLVGSCIQDGSIKNVDQKVGDFIPEFKKGASAELTIKHLLTMSSGLNWEESYSSPFATVTEAYYGDNLKGLTLNLQVVQTPGKHYSYMGANTQLLAYIIKKASGKEVSEYASNKLWKPIGASYDALWSLDKKEGDEKAYCCFNSNASDFAKIGQLVLNNGKWNGKQLIPETFLNEALQPASYLKDENGKPVDYYGYHWWITEHKGMKIPYARGILGQYILLIPDKNMVIVRLGHQRDEKAGNHYKEIYTYINAALEMI